MSNPVATVLGEIADEQGAAYAASARRAWAALTDDGGPADVSQYSLQVYCWAVLVRSEDDPALREQTVRALSDLLGRLGLHRYASIAWGDQTRELLQSVLVESDGGRSTYGRLMHESGVVPADTELLSWGSAFGPIEGGLIRRVADTIELGAVTGEVRPGHRSAGRERRAVTRAVLLAPTPERPDAPTLSWVLAERADLWAEAGRSARRQELLEPLVGRVVEAQPLTQEVDLTDVLAGLRWLVERCREPERLTSAGYLRPVTVRAFVDAVSRGPYAPGGGGREAHQPEVLYTRQVAQALGLLRRHAGSLSTTKRAGAAGTTEQLAALVARRLLDRGPWEVELQAREVVVALFLAGSTTFEDLNQAVTDVLGELGWQSRDGSALGSDDCYWLTAEAFRELLHVGLVTRRDHSRDLTLTSGSEELLLESVRQLLAHRDPADYVLR